jgi:DNA-binding IclR family transcriptional regulator
MNSKKNKANAAYSAPIVSKAMRVLGTIVKAERNQGISEIASSLSLAKSTTHGILTALEESGWVLRDPISRKYTCGHAFKELGTSAEVRLPLVKQARPYLEELGGRLNQDVFLGILAAKRVLILDQVESDNELRVATRPGTGISIYAGSVGRIFLAYQDREWTRDLLNSLPLPSFTPKSVTDAGKYLVQLDQVLADGIAHDVGEYIPSVWCVAVPVLHGSKNRTRMVAAFWIVGLDPAPAREMVERIQRLARQTGEALSLAITAGTNDI